LVKSSLLEKDVLELVDLEEVLELACDLVLQMAAYSTSC
jgi:hypothetical protein